DLDLILSDAGVASVLGPFDCACFKRPTGPGTLADFSYEPAGGTWTLTASDGFPADDGVLESWCLRIDGADCQLPPPVALGCSESGGDVLLAWTNPESYDSLELRRDGALVATLPGGATSAIDPAVPPGPHRYAVAGVSDALGCESPSRECALVTGLVAYQTERVVLVLIDGMRYSEGLGDPLREHVPQMDLLSQQGAIIEPFINDGFTNTARAIPAIWSGAWTGIETFEDYHCEGAANRASVLPTIFEYYRRQLGRPAVECVQMVGSLGGGCPWRSSFHSDYGTEFWPAVFQEGASDLEIFSHFEEVLESLQPRLLYFYLPDVDHAGHSGVWDDYLAAIETADSVVGMLWAAIEANPEYAGVTTMLVTNDHGRHSYDFTGHGDGCDGCRTIELLAVGPDIVPGLVSEVPRTLRDIAPTIGALLGFVTEHSTGEVMTEILLSGPLLRRGDVDGDGLILLNDSILILFYLFAGGAAACVDAADIDDDGQVLIGDAILHLGHLFAGGPPPAPPFPGCGIDPSPDAGADLGCEGPVVGCQ
ncbi:MAG: alkaline phosphatase family protein, partial [Planctomycetota bacterium]